MIPKTFCVLPWYSQEIYPGFQTVCCLLPKHANVSQIKDDLLQGKSPVACNKCWTIEKTGQQSRRQQENIFLDYKLDRDIENIFQDCVEGYNQTLMYQITLSNRCNQACTTCNSQLSSRWADIDRKMQISPKPLYVIDIDQLHIDYARAKRINITGGEPLFEPITYQLLQKLLDHGNDQCFISFVTNGSISLSAYQADLFAAFKDKNICVSIDGIESRFEYLRWPGNWETLQKNLETYRKIPNTSLSVSYTISALNAIYFDETVTWFKQQDLKFNHNLVYSPSWASLNTMPVQLKYQLQKHEFLHQSATITGREISAERMLQNIQAQDAAKKIACIDYMPDLYKLLTCK